MGDECTCEQCRGFNERAAGEWPVGVTAAAGRGANGPGHERLLVVGKGGISIRLRAPDAVARAGRASEASARPS